MFRNVPCAEPGCGRFAFAERKFCIAHLEDSLEVSEAALGRIAEETSTKDRNLSGIRVVGRDFSRKKFVRCSFTGAYMHNVLFTGAIFRLCFFDRATIDSCDFSGVDMDFCSFGDADIVDSSFENSELIHVNFDGSRISMSTFSSSNLYDSRFIMSSIKGSSFDNCDFKRAYFILSKEENVTMRGSNTVEAVRELGELYR